MSIASEILKSSETLFSNPDALDPDFVPKLLPHREGQQEYIALAIKPLFQDRNGKNLLIRGASGIGKTAATKRVLYDLEEVEESEMVPALFVNCWTQNTTFKILSNIAHSLGFKFTHNMNTSEILEKIKEILKKRKGAVFTFDEVDKADDYDFLYLLSEEISKKAILLITNDFSFGEDLDPRVKSRLLPELVEFPEYSLQETEDILRERVKYAFYQNVWEDAAVKKIAEQSFKFKDIRIGIVLLKVAGELAENAASKKIKVEHAEKAIAKTDAIKIKASTDLTDEERLVLDLCKIHAGKIFGEFFDEYVKSGGKKSDRTVKRLLDKLENRKLIKQEAVMEGLQGRSSKIIYIGFEKKLN